MISVHREHVMKHKDEFITRVITQFPRDGCSYYSKKTDGLDNSFILVTMLCFALVISSCKLKSRMQRDWSCTLLHREVLTMHLL